MFMEKIIRPVPGFIALLSAAFLIIIAVLLFSYGSSGDMVIFNILAILAFLTGIFLFKGVMVINPNHSSILTFLYNWPALYTPGLLYVPKLPETSVTIHILTTSNAVFVQ